MPQGSNPKRERQYEHIKASAKQRGESTGRAEEIAARTVNKERARSGEAKNGEPHLHPGHVLVPARRAALTPRCQGPTYAQLYSEARRSGMKGRSSMNKAQLVRALGR